MQMHTDADLLDLFAPGTHRDDDGGLRIAGCRVDELAAAYGTPLMLVDESHLRATVRAWQSGLEARCPGSRVMFASKAFPCTAVYRLMAEEGIGVDVAGGGELVQALTERCRSRPQILSLHGNAKTVPRSLPRTRPGVGLAGGRQPRRSRPAGAPFGSPAKPRACSCASPPGVEGETHASISTGRAGCQVRGSRSDQAAAALRRAASHPV